jgi:hypothetical protein
MFAESGVPPISPQQLSVEEWEEAHLAPPSAVRAEGRARSAMRAALASLLPAAEAAITAGAEQESRRKEKLAHLQQESAEEGSEQAYLREHIELRGYLPLTGAIEVRFALCIIPS